MINQSKHFKKIKGVTPARYAVSKSGNQDLPPCAIIIGRKNLTKWLNENVVQTTSLKKPNKRGFIKIKIPAGLNKKNFLMAIKKIQLGDAEVLGESLF